MHGLYNSLSTAWAVHTCSDSDGVGTLDGADDTTTCRDSVEDRAPAPEFLVEVGQWTFVAASFDATQAVVTLHVNGASASFPARLHDSSSVAGLTLAMHNAPNAVGLHGAMDAAFLYRRALTTRELVFLRTFAPQLPAPAPGQWGYALAMNGGMRDTCSTKGACPGTRPLVCLVSVGGAVVSPCAHPRCVCATNSLCVLTGQLP